MAGDNEEARAKVKEEAATNMTQIEIRYQEQVLRILQAAGADTTEAEKKILDLKAALLDQDVKNHAKAEDEKTKKTKEEEEKRREIDRRILEVLYRVPEHHLRVRERSL
jgi:Fe2+ transport system protein B